jgi:hypothetical protein
VLHVEHAPVEAGVADRFGDDRLADMTQVPTGACEPADISSWRKAFIGSPQ